MSLRVRRSRAVHVLAAAALLFAAVASAQDAQKLPALDLSDAQKQTLFISITNQNFKNEAPPNFQPIVGAVVPENVELEAMPKTIVELAPATEGFRVARIVNQAVIVDPQTRRVIEVIAGKP